MRCAKGVGFFAHKANVNAYAGQVALHHFANGAHDAFIGNKFEFKAQGLAVFGAKFFAGFELPSGFVQNGGGFFKRVGVGFQRNVAERNVFGQQLFGRGLLAKQHTLYYGWAVNGAHNGLTHSKLIGGEEGGIHGQQAGIARRRLAGGVGRILGKGGVGIRI